MGRRSHTRTLGLWMNGARLGTWSLAPNAPDTLQYDLDWAQSEQGRPLSLSLPFTPGNAPHRGEKVRAYFENLLPDSKDIRERLARRFKTGSTDAFELLAEIGRDCVGALEILPEGQASAGIAAVQAEPLGEAQVAQVLRSATTPHAMGWGSEDDDFRIVPRESWRTEDITLNGLWFVYMGPYPDRELFNRKQAELKAIGGISFREVRTPSSLANGFVLGRFEQPQEAQAALNKLKERGVRSARVVIIRPRMQAQNVIVPQATAGMQTSLNGVRLPQGKRFAACP